MGRKATRPRNVTPASGGIAARAGGGRPEEIAGARQSYHGHRVVPAGDGWTTDIDGSVFDSKTDAQRFIRAWSKRNPKKKRNDLIDEAVAAAVGVTDTLYTGMSVPYQATMEGVRVALKGKDAAKKALGLNPKSKSKRKSRKNPAEAAEKLSEKFHGKPSDEEIVITEKIHEHEHLAAAGRLIAVVVETPTGLEATIRFAEREADESTPWLAFSEDGKQAYIEGGNQELDLAALGMDAEEWIRDRMVIGQFAAPRGRRDWNITYRTRKKFDKFQVIDYQHLLGEVNDQGDYDQEAAPYLEYEPRNKKLYVTGGKYVIRQPLMGMSPGVEG